MNIEEPSDGGDKVPRWFTLVTVVVLAGLAVGMGWPSMRGQYSSGDDIQLVRDNVLVNHPSLRHALKLFVIPAHRDLYQPVALLSFQMDFAVGQWVSFRGDPRVVHLHNILAHALNAVLVFLLLRQVTRRPAVAALAGLLMAVHPLNVEAMAWINGRMMLQSTTYFLLGLMAFEHWRRQEGERGWGWLGLALLLILWTMLSKVRVELPAILILLLIYQRVRPRRRWWRGWAAATGITAVFSYWAVVTTGEGDMFKAIAVYTEGPRLARTFQSLAWYFQHYVWPSELGPWHPPEPVVTWTGGDIPPSVVLVLVVLVFVGWSWRAGRSGVVGMLWFLGAIFSTLPLIGARGVVAGERYAYLPGIGLHWLSAAGLVWAASWSARAMGRRLGPVVCGAALTMVAGVFVTIGRRTCEYYHSSIRLAHRVVELYPETPDVFVDLAWAYIREGRYQEGLEYARKQFDHGEPDECLIYQAVAWAQFRSGDLEGAEESLLRAREANPEYSKVYYRLGEVYFAAGRWEEAERMYVESVQRTPLYLPAQAALARLYMEQGRQAEAEARYKDILAKVNPYHPESRYNLGDIYLTRGRYDLARGQYERLLSYMPEHARARANLGLCLQRMGDRRGALRAYEEALGYEPGLLAARLNRAALLVQMGRLEEGQVEYQNIRREFPREREALFALSELLLSAGQEAGAIGLWRRALESEPGSAELQAGLAWTLSRSDEYAAALEPARGALQADDSLTLARLAMGMAQLRGGAYGSAAETFEQIAAKGRPNPEDAYGEGVEALARVSAAEPDSPWPYYFTALMLAAQGRHEEAALGLEEFAKRCSEAGWVERARDRLEDLRGRSAKGPA